MSIQVSPHMAKNRLVKDLSGNIIDWLDESKGGWIVRGRTIVNQEAWDAIQKKKQDEIEASRAIALQKNDPDAPDRTVSASVGVENLKKASTQSEKVAELDKKVNEMDTKLDKILNALNGKS